MSSTLAAAPTADADRLQRLLERETRAEVRFDAGARALYATDASLYQITPIGVVVPRTAADVADIVRVAAEERVPIVARGSATSLSGQTIGAAIIIDFSKYLNRIGVVDRDRMRVRVEPGVVLDQLNAHLKPLGLMFGPDVSTSDRATIGGMIGNNSAGARSLRYGKTVDHVHALDVVCADGSAANFAPLDAVQLDEVCRRDDLSGRAHAMVREVVARHESSIRARYPHILRRVSGYNLDEFIPGLPPRATGWVDEPWRFNLARLVVGSEGTLAVVRGAELKVVPRPAATGLATISFASIEAALERVLEIVETGPVAVEMLDRAILDLAASNPIYAKMLSFASGRPAAVLSAQYYADTKDEIASRVDDLTRRFEGKPGVLGVHRSLVDAEKDDFWKVRKAGLSLLMGMVGDAKPVAFVEDTAVAPERLPEFYRRFQAIVAGRGLSAACYGHADVGCLHIRPILNTKIREGVDDLRAIARDVSDLVVEFGGAMSGEHGDGLARSLWNRKLFGDELYTAFETIKAAFDPHNLLNPGKVVHAPDLTENLRLGPDYHAREPASTALDFSAQGGFARAVEMCSGVGVCRKTSTGTMCPSYMITRDEKDSTRGRANALRLVLSGELPAESLDHPALADALELCLQCKACKTECPSNVDMAKLKAEVLFQSYKRKLVPIGSLLMANIFRLNPIGSKCAPVANWTLRQGWLKRLLELVAGIDRRRTLPTFASDDLRGWFRGHVPDARAGRLGSVVLLDDCFTTYNNPDVGRAAVRVLEAAGYRVELAGLRCCGRAAISKGLLDVGRELAAENVAKLAEHARAGVAIVGCEPSCVLTLRDEYLDFRLGPDARAVADAALLVDDFVADVARVPELPTRSRSGRVLLHGHCQQKAMVGAQGSLAALKRIPDLEVDLLDSGCCGMAGSFGYEVGHFDLSRALAERVLIPAAVNNPGATFAAPGFSCRSQLHGLAEIAARHPIEIIAEQLCD